MAKKVINDAGHGGIDGGASANGFVEKNLTLEASQYVHKRLTELGVKSSQTRTSDVTLDLTPRAKKVRESGYDICLSHHYNAGGGEGVETIHSKFASNKLAKLIADEISKVGQKFRRVYTKVNNKGYDYFAMHRETGSVETVIIEYAFLDNKTDANKIKDKAYREKMYEAVVKAVCTYIGVKYVAPKSSTPKQESKPSTSGKTMYRVVTGSFADKANAEKRVKELKAKGFDSFIDVVKI